MGLETRICALRLGFKGGETDVGEGGEEGENSRVKAKVIDPFAAAAKKTKMGGGRWTDRDRDEVR